MQGFNEQQCTRALSFFRNVKTPAVAVLWGTFTTHGKCLPRFLRQYADRSPIVEIHISNEAGRRNKRLREGELKTITRATVKARALEIKRFIDLYGSDSTSWILSTGLEDNYSRRRYALVLTTLKSIFKDSVLYARSPHRDRFLGSADLFELHGAYGSFPPGQAGCIYSNDGSDIDFNDGRSTLDGAISISRVSASIKRAQRDGCHVFAWWSGAQGIERGRFIDPRKRSFRIYSSQLNTIRGILWAH